MKAKNHFPNVSLLITHYNRSASLEKLLKSLIEAECSFKCVIVSDDASNLEHKRKLFDIQERYNFTLISSSTNRGLGNNINKGEDNINTPYTLYIQEDFEASIDFSTHFTNALQIMEECEELDIARFYAYFKYPYLQLFKNGFSKMYFNAWLKGYRKFYEYSDHPHLRRNTFLEKFGRYAEGLNPEKTEYRMMFSFLQNRGQGIFYNDYKNLFFQKIAIRNLVQ